MDNMDKERSDFVQSGLTLQDILINGNKDLSGSLLIVLVVVHKWC